MDGVELEILWSNLIGIVTERAKALQRIAFSPVVREAGDLACALFDRRGRMVAQANTGTPGHINSLAIAGAHLVRIFANNLKPGDVVTTNDPWLSAGHFFDITVLTPIFEPCPVLHALIKQNVRTPDAVFGDLAAQVSSGQAASERLIAMCRRYGLIDIEELSDEIISRSETATRQAIAKLKPGTFHGESSFDVPGGQVITLKSAVTIDPDAGEILIDFTGSTPQTTSGINVVLNYTHAYSTFAIRSCLNPELPNNTGSLAPIKVHAPKGSILNCEYPAPVAARHVVGMYVPMPILKALYHVMPDRVLAEGSGAVWTMQIQGKRADGQPFTSSMFNYSGGMGARASKVGPSATCYPTGVAAVPVEIVEAVTPVLFDRKELRPGSGGDGAMRGGDGNAVASRVEEGPEGLGGGEPGAAGKFHINGVAVRDLKKLTLQPGDVVLFETPGGGGYGHR